MCRLSIYHLEQLYIAYINEVNTIYSRYWRKNAGNIVIPRVLWYDDCENRIFANDVRGYVK